MTVVVELNCEIHIAHYSKIIKKNIKSEICVWIFIWDQCKGGVLANRSTVQPTTPNPNPPTPPSGRGTCDPAWNEEARATT